MNRLTLLPRVAAYALAVVVGAVIVGVWRALGFDLVWLAVATLAVWVLWLHLDRANVHDKADAATDDADQAIGRIEAVEHHLSGNEPASTGRHSDGQPSTYPTRLRTPAP